MVLKLGCTLESASKKGKPVPRPHPDHLNAKLGGEGTDVTTFQDPSGNFKIEPHLGTGVLSSCFSNVTVHTKHLGIV